MYVQDVKITINGNQRGVKIMELKVGQKIRTRNIQEIRPEYRNKEGVIVELVNELSVSAKFAATPGPGTLVLRKDIKEIIE